MYVIERSAKLRKELKIFDWNFKIKKILSDLKQMK